MRSLSFGDLFLGEVQALRRGLQVLLSNVEDKPRAYGLTHDDVEALRDLEARAASEWLGREAGDVRRAA